jgi:hypothetical protein
MCTPGLRVPFAERVRMLHGLLHRYSLNSASAASQKKQVSFGNTPKTVTGNKSTAKKNVSSKGGARGRPESTGQAAHSASRPVNGQGATKKMRLNLRDIDVDISNAQDAKVALRLAQNLTRKANAVLQQNGMTFRSSAVPYVSLLS